MYKVLKLIIIIIFIYIINIYSEFGNGLEKYNFLRLGNSAYRTAMSHSNRTVLTDISVIHDNPAVLGQLFYDNTVSVSNSLLYSNIIQTSIQFVKKDILSHNVSVSINNLFAPGVERYSVKEVFLGKSSYHVMAADFSFGRRLKRINYGFNAKYIYEDLLTKTNLGMLVDAGVIIRDVPISFALGFENIKFGSSIYKSPLNIYTSLSIKKRNELFVSIVNISAKYYFDLSERVIQIGTEILKERKYGFMLGYSVSNSISFNYKNLTGGVRYYYKKYVFNIGLKYNSNLNLSYFIDFQYVPSIILG